MGDPIQPPNPSGLCMCGCGQPAPVATITNRRAGKVAGQPQRYILGHRLSRGGPVRLFWSYVDRRGPDECWPWKGPLLNKYGAITVRGKRGIASRFSYELHYGPIPEGMQVCHTCDNPGCQNPAHLWLGTMADNQADMWAKGRSNRARGESNGCAKLTESSVVEIRRLRGAGMTYTAISRRFGVDKSNIRNICLGKKWQHVAE